MEIKKTAFFVREPSVIENLMRPHLLEQEKPYHIVSVVQLDSIDYMNFITDMLADRQFIEDHSAACGYGEVMKCILVKKKKAKDGVLVVPRLPCYVGYAAYYPGEP